MTLSVQAVLLQGIPKFVTPSLSPVSCLRIRIEVFSYNDFAAVN